jgi:hypothetical protein
MEFVIRLTNFLCKNVLLRIPKKLKPGQIKQNLLRKVMAQRGLFANDVDDDDDD